MPKSIAVFGAGPGLGRAVARRYAREGYTVVLVARRRAPLDALAQDLTGTGATAHVITADLADAAAIAPLARRVRAAAGDLDAFYYGVSSGGFRPALALEPRHAQDAMPLGLYALLALVQEFLPHMLDQGDGAILTAQGASTLRGVPNLSGPGPALAAQRNYLQSLRAEVAGKGVYVGGLYIGAVIENSAFHAQVTASEATGTATRHWGLTVDPAHLADLLWTMHREKDRPEAAYPERNIDRVTTPDATVAR